MRKADLSAEEIFEAEKAKDERQRSRAKGFKKMHERDAGAVRLLDYNGSSVLMQWHVPEERRLEGVAYSGIPDGMFSLLINGKTVVFDAEEFRKWLRWV